MNKEFLWVEKYRPQKISETILNKNLKKVFQTIVNSGELQNMIFSGTAGTGKTTIAKAMCNELGLNYLFINGSEEGNIDTLRTKIKRFASSVSLQGGYKVVILDEADGLNPLSFQPALRSFIEEFSSNCRFILTCNFKNKIIEPLHSRCSVYEFAATKKDLMNLSLEFHKRIQDILKNENVDYDPKTIADLVMRHAPDWRRVINECQRYSTVGKIDDNIVDIPTTKFSELFSFIKDKNFKKIRQWVSSNIDIDPPAIFRGLYNEMYEAVDQRSIPNMILILADYQYKASFVVDHEINIMACMIEIMTNVELK